MKLKQKICSTILKWWGWRIEQNCGALPPKCVIAVAPHTSNWDLFVGKTAIAALGKRCSFLIKDSWLFFPVSCIIRSMGGIGVDRTARQGMTERLSAMFSQRDEFYLAIAPEGTRKRNENWKKGFYYIALGAQVPILVVVMNYASKTLLLQTLFQPGGDADVDIPLIRSYYKNAVGIHPAQFSETE